MPTKEVPGVVVGPVCGTELEDGSTCPAPVPPGSASARCDACRAEHRRKKKADYQWAYRIRQREKARAAAAARGVRLSADPPPGPRDLTPSWTQQGDEAAGQDRAALLRDLARQLDEAQATITRVRTALRDASRR